MYWWVAIISAAVVVALMTFAPQRRLRLEPPGEFLALQSPTRHQPDEQLARAYWNSASRSLQWKFSYGAPLPETPPPEFQPLSEAGTGVWLNEPPDAVRKAYWDGMRKAWLAPGSWHTVYEARFSWLQKPFEWVQDRAEHMLER